MRMNWLHFTSSVVASFWFSSAPLRSCGACAYRCFQERIAKAPKLKMAVTAGIGSDHVDLQAAMSRKIDVVEVTYCNSE